MKRAITIIATLTATATLVGCDIGKSDAWHVGHCMGGQLYSQGMNEAPTMLVALAFTQAVTKYGFSMDELTDGYVAYRKNPGGDYSKSCKIAREIDAGRR